MPDVNSIPFKQADPNGHYRSKQLPNDQGEFLEMLGLPAFAGDVVGPAGSTAGQAVVFSDGTGKRIDGATQTGLAKLASGVLSTVAAPIGAVVGTTDVQTLTNKTLVSPVITGTGIELQANKGVANGYASLDASTKVPMAQIPDALVGASQYQGTWNAATNTPAIPAAAVGNKGWYYSVSVAGTTNINGISSWAVGDQIISSGSVWQKIPNVSAVNSVNGQTGVVVLSKSDVGLGNVDNTSDAAKNSAVATLTNKTLTSPTINTPTITSPTGLVKGDVGLANVDNTSDATKNAAAVTLTNKTINGANNTLTVRLANDVTGNLPVANLNSGTGANSGSFWRGDGQWAPPAGGGDTVGPSASVDGELPLYSGTSGKVLKRCALTGFVKAAASGAATGQAQMDAADLAPGAIHNQTQKATALLDADEFLVWDSSVSALRRIAAPLVRYLPGEVVQTVYQTANATMSFTTAWDYTLTPTITGGTEIINAAITPRYANSIIIISVQAQIAMDADDRPMGWICVSGVTNALAARIVSILNGLSGPFVLEYPHNAGSVAARTYSVRMATTAAARGCYVNRVPSITGLFGGLLSVTTLKLQEIKQ